MAGAIGVENRAGVAEAEFGPLAAALAGHRSIQIAIEWLVAQAPPLVVADMVTHDEFSHDVLVARPDGSFLVYDAS